MTILLICSIYEGMKRFVDHSGKNILLSKNAEEHIHDFHPEITLEQIKLTLVDPDEIRSSSYKSSTVLYYRIRIAKRYICVVVKQCPDGWFISTAMTTAKPKLGEVLYVKSK